MILVTLQTGIGAKKRVAMRHEIFRSNFKAGPGNGVGTKSFSLVVFCSHAALGHSFFYYFFEFYLIIFKWFSQSIYSIFWVIFRLVNKNLFELCQDLSCYTFLFCQDFL